MCRAGSRNILLIQTSVRLRSYDANVALVLFRIMVIITPSASSVCLTFPNPSLPCNRLISAALKFDKHTAADSQTLDQQQTQLQASRRTATEQIEPNTKRPKSERNMLPTKCLHKLSATSDVNVQTKSDKS